MKNQSLNPYLLHTLPAAGVAHWCSGFRSGNFAGKSDGMTSAAIRVHNENREESARPTTIEQME